MAPMGEAYLQSGRLISEQGEDGPYEWHAALSFAMLSVSFRITGRSQVDFKQRSRTHTKKEECREKSKHTTGFFSIDCVLMSP